MPEISDNLPKSQRAIQSLLEKTDPKHFVTLDNAIEQAIIKAWASVHGTGQIRKR